MAKQARWQESLAKFDFKFEYKVGKSNQEADALSRKGQHAALCMLAHIHSSKIDGSMRDIIKEHLHKDPSTKAVVELAKAGKTRQFWVGGDLLMTKGNRLYIPRTKELKKELIQKCHDTLWVEHLGWQRTYVLIQKGYFWPNMRDDIMQYTKTCLICQ